MIETKLPIIKCPYCGYEYLPAEVFVDILGNPKNIVRTVDGKIDYYSGERPSLTETYYCDHCDKRFSVNVDLSFESFIDSENDFDSDFESKLYNNRLTLEEDNLFEPEEFLDEEK